MALSELPSVSVRREAVVRGEAGFTVVWLRGEHDLASKPELSKTLAHLIAFDAADLVVDLSEVRFMDASTIGVIIQARNLLRARSRTLTLRSPARCARLVLDVCGLAHLIEPRPREAKPAPSSALGTWVAVPSVDRIEPSDHGPAPISWVPATTETTSDDAGEPAGEGGMVHAGQRGP